jgi:hypothetical protein
MKYPYYGRKAYSSSINYPPGAKSSGYKQDASRKKGKHEYNQ